MQCHFIVFNSCNTGKSALPDMYAQCPRARSTRGWGVTVFTTFGNPCCTQQEVMSEDNVTMGISQCGLIPTYVTS